MCYKHGLDSKSKYFKAWIVFASSTLQSHGCVSLCVRWAMLYIYYRTPGKSRLWYILPIWYNRPYASCCSMLSVVPYFMSEYCKLHTNYNPNSFVPLCEVVPTWRAYELAHGGPYCSRLISKFVYYIGNITNLKLLKYNNGRFHTNTQLVIQSSALKTRSNIISFYINNFTNWGRILIRCWIHKRHPTPRPNGRAMGCLLWIIVRKLTAFYRLRNVCHHHSCTCMCNHLTVLVYEQVQHK